MNRYVALRYARSNPGIAAPVLQTTLEYPKKARMSKGRCTARRPGPRERMQPPAEEYVGAVRQDLVSRLTFTDETPLSKEA